MYWPNIFMKYDLNIVHFWKTGPTLWLLSKVNIISFVDILSASLIATWLMMQACCVIPICIWSHIACSPTGLPLHREKKTQQPQQLGNLLSLCREIAGARDILQKFENLKKQHEWNFNL
jgi:hypothetical protein